MKCDTYMTLKEAREMLGIVDRQPQEMTNEEWFCQLPTEEKAEWLYRVHYGGIGIGLTKEEIRKWLKEVHKE